MPEPERAIPVLPWMLIKFTPDAPPQEMVRGEPYTLSIDGRPMGIFHPLDSALDWFVGLPTAEAHEQDIAVAKDQLRTMGVRFPG